MTLTLSSHGSASNKKVVVHKYKNKIHIVLLYIMAENNTTDHMFECERCHFQTQYKRNLVAHLKKENQCVARYVSTSPVELLKRLETPKNVGNCIICPYCQKLMSKTNISKHKKICSKKVITQQKNNNIISENIVSEQESEVYDQRIKQLEQTVENLKQEIQTIKQIKTECSGSNEASCSYNSNGTTINGGSHNITIVNNNIQLNNFGDEDLEHITAEIIRHCMMNNINGMRNLIEKIHFSKEKLQNRNIRIKSRKDKLVEVFNDNLWIIKDANDAIELMIKKVGKICNEFYQSDKDGIQRYDIECLRNKIQQFLLELLMKNSNDYYALRKRVLATIVDHTETKKVENAPM